MGVEFGSLEVRPWVGVCGWSLSPAQLEWVPECTMGKALGEGVGQGLCSVQPEGVSKDGGSDLGDQQIPQCPSGQGKCYPCSLPFLHYPEGLSYTH